MSSIEIAFKAASGFAACVSSLVLLTVIVFPKMRERIFMKIIANMALCDMIGSAMAAFGFLGGGSQICIAQSFLVEFFFKAGWLWTVALAYQLYCVVIYSKFGLSIFHMHALCWSFTAITTLLPLTTNRFGRDDDEGIGWCFLTGNQTTASIWGILTFNAILLIAVLLISYYLFRIYWRYRTMNIKASYPEIYTIIDLLILYPPGFLITWGPNLIMSVVLNFRGISLSQNNITVFNAVSILATQSGTLVTAIFFLKSKEARHRWGRLFKQLCNCSLDSVRSSEQSEPFDFHEEVSYERRLAAEMSVAPSEERSFQESRLRPTTSSDAPVIPSAQSNSQFSASHRYQSNQTSLSQDEFHQNPLFSGDGEDSDWNRHFRATSEYGYRPEL